jgi:PAS domain S-box-containing protein
MSRVPRSEILLRYIVAVVAVVLALIISLALRSLIPTIRFPMFYAAVALSAWLGGLGPGLLATILSSLIADYYLVTPTPALALDPLSLVQVGLFAAVSIFISVLGYSRKRSQDYVGEQREWLRTTLASIGDAVIATDINNRIAFMNPVAEALTGWKETAALNKPLGEIFHIVNEQTRQPVENPLQRVLREGRVVGLANHTVLIDRNGAEHPIDDSGAPIKDADGNLFGAVLVFRDVTERRRAEAQKAALTAQVQQERERLSNIVSTIPGVVWEAWSQPDGSGLRIDFVSDYVETLLGYSKEEWLSTPNFWLTIVHPEDRERAEATSAAILKSGGKGYNQFRWVTKDGRVLWVETQSMVIADESGKPLGMRGVTMDISERMAAEEVIRQQADLLEQAQDAIFVWEFGNRIVQWYHGAELLYGFPREEAIGQIASELLNTIHPIPRSEIEDILRRTGAWEGELLHTTRDGRQVIVQSRFALVTYKDGRQLVLEVTRDITDRKRAETAVEEERNLLRTVIETAPDYIYVRDGEGRFIINNAEHRRILGAKSLEEVVGKRDQDFFPKELAERYEADDTQVMQAGQPLINREEPTADPEGHKEWVLTTKVPLRDRQGKVIGLVGISRDITERKRAQDAEHFMSEASTALASSLDYETTLASVARLAVPTIADWCSVHIVTEDGSVQQLAVTHIDPEKVKWAYELQRRYPPDPNAPRGLHQVIRSGQPEITPEITDAMLTAAITDPELLQIARDIGFSSAMTVPLIARGQTLGAIQLVSAESGRHYGPADVAMAEELARRAAIAVDNARLYREAQLARDVAETTADRIARLQGITAALSEALTPEQVADVILNQGIDSVGANVGSILLLSPDKTSLEIVSARGLAEDMLEEWRRFSVETETPIGEAVRTGNPVWIESLEERNRRYPNLPPANGLDSWAAVPMKIEKRILGGLTLGFAERRTFGEDDRAFILALALQSGQAIERARLYAETQASADVLRQRVEERTQELQEALVQAQGADRAKGALLATVSHEMRTPLSSIVGFSNLILSRKPEPQKLFEYASFINAEARRLATLINDFLDLQRIEAGREVFRYAEVDLATLVRDVVGKQQLGENSPHSIRLDISPASPVYADPDRIRQVILNLLSNALKYSSGGEIVIAVREENGSVICSVRDRGLGIPTEELGRLFERFYRGDVAERMRIRGTGLGLALCREIVEAHHGRIWAESAGANQGSTFSFSLPMQHLVAVPGSTQGGQAAGAAGGLIVVVEDDTNFATYLSERLRPEGYRVQVLNFETATPESIAGLGTALIVLDILQGEDQPGWPLLSALKQHPDTRGIPVLVCTVLRNHDHAWQLGASAYVTKPVDEGFLLGEIGRLIGPAPHTVLVVDDSEALRTLLRETLSGAGYEVETAENGQVAIERLSRGWPDLIILDLLMPHIDGFSVLDWIRNDQHKLQVPVIVFTAAELTPVERRLLTERANALATKADTSPQQLLDLIRDMLEER